MYIPQNAHCGLFLQIWGLFHKPLQSSYRERLLKAPSDHNKALSKAPSKAPSKGPSEACSDDPSKAPSEGPSEALSKGHRAFAKLL